MKTRLYALMRAVVPALALVAGGSAFAQDVFTYWDNYVGPGMQRVEMGSGGRPIVTKGAPSFATSGGPVEVSRSLVLRNPSGVVYDVQAKVAVPPAVLGRAIKGLAGSLPFIGTGVALFQVAQELGYFVEKQPGLPLTITRVDPNACTVGPCLQYRVSDGSRDSGWLGSRQSACSAVAVISQTTNPSANMPYSGQISGSAPGGLCTVVTNAGSPLAYLGISSRSVSPTTGQQAATLDDLADAIAAKSGWPGPSSIGMAYEQAISALTGEPFTAAPLLTGPATTAGPTTTTDTGTELITQTVTHNHNYTGPVITTTTTTTTNTVDKTTGQPTRSPTVVVTQPAAPAVAEPSPSEPAPFEMPCGVAGTPPCDVKVDETDVPSPTDIKIDQADDALDTWDDFVTNIASRLPAFPTINWAFSLPTGCGVIPLAAFEPYLTGIDICQYQPMFHELMSVVWVLGGLFGAISLFMRSALSMN